MNTAENSMKIFAIDTTVKVATAALVENGRLTAEYSLNTDTHSTTLLPMISSVLELSGRSIEDIKLLAVSGGPGSFTGVRIGVSTLKGLAFANNIPCVGVSSLEAMAMNFVGLCGTVVPVINARNKMVYSAMFSSDGKELPNRVTQDEQIPIADLVAKLKQVDTPIYFTGDAYDLLWAEKDSLSNVVVTPEKLRIPSGYGVAVAAERIWSLTEDKSMFDEARLSPIYLRKSQAEREREEKLGIK